MKKDAFYFPHFANARHDRKLKRVIKEIGVEGYGIYFMLLEVLREQQDFRYPMKDVDLLADEFGTSEQKLKTVICNYELFQIDNDGSFFSMKQIFYLQPYVEKTERARNAAKIRWEGINNQQVNANAYANAEQMQCSSNASKVKESKVKESKVKISKGELHLFSESLVFNKEKFKLAFAGTPYESANFDYYHEIVNNWSNGNLNKKIDWVATARNFMASDLKNGKFIDLNYKPNASNKLSEQSINQALSKHFSERK